MAGSPTRCCGAGVPTGRVDGRRTALAARRSRVRCGAPLRSALRDRSRVPAALDWWRPLPSRGGCCRSRVGESRGMKLLMVTLVPPQPHAWGAIPVLLHGQLTALRGHHDVTLITLVADDAER